MLLIYNFYFIFFMMMDASFSEDHHGKVFAIVIIVW